jgi:peptidoglycan hydrolase CwlO-like protein
MKNLIVAFFLALSSTAFGQYPCLETDSTGQQIVIMTLEQAQSLDNATDILAIFESVGAKLGEYDSACIKIVSEMDQIISSQTVQISDLKSQVDTKESKILNLRSEVAEKDSTIATYKLEIENKNKEIDLHVKEIRNNRWAFGAGGGAVGVIVGIVIGIFATH